MERWLPIPGFEGFYEVPDLGRFRSVARKAYCGHGSYRTVPPRILKQTLEGEGYALVSLSTGFEQQSYRAHRMVLLAFVGPCPDGMESRHDNGVRNDNKLSNLSWGTPIENWQDRKRHERERMHHV